MKQLLLMRHGKSDWNSAFGRDHQRPLAKRGVQAAQAAGRFLSQTGQAPEHVISSTAVRASTTAELAQQAGAWACDLVTTERLYAASQSDVLELIQQQSEQHQSLMLVGHEPTFSGLIQSFCGARARMPTAAVAAIRLFEPDWRSVRFGDAELLFLFPSRMMQKLA